MSSLFLMLGVLNNGHMIGVTDRRQTYAVYHQNLAYENERYTFDGGQVHFPFAKNRFYSASFGLKMGIEAHPNSQAFNNTYLVQSPLIALNTKYRKYNAAAYCDFGKGFQTLSTDNVGRDKSGYTSKINLTLSVFMNLTHLNRNTKNGKK